jgi:hypothetical protein
MTTFSASPTNRTVLSQSHNCSCYIITLYWHSPPSWLQKHTDLRAHDFAHSSGLWRQPNLANVTCAWRWRLCGINPATACSYLINMILPYDHPTYSLVRRFSLRSHSSRGRKYSLMWLPFSLVSPVATYSASVHGIDDPSLIISLQRNIQEYTVIQWRTQEFFRGVGVVQQIQLRTEGRENGDMGAVAH